jgi:Domain of unknown function (DUF4129)
LLQTPGALAPRPLSPPATDSLRRALDHVFAGPEYQWVQRKQLVSWLGRQWQYLKDWFNQLGDAHPTTFNIIVWVLVIALVALLVHIGYVMWRILRPPPRVETRVAPGVGVIMDARAHIAMAERLAAAGRYAEALAHRFVAAVLELDQRHAVRFHVSKTPAEYITEARLDANGRAALTTLVMVLYRHLFGAVPCDAGEYRAFSAAAQELSRGPYVVPA